MEGLTVGQLLNDINKLVAKDKSILNKKVLVADDEEGNAYHSLYFSITSKPNDVKECVEYSNGADIEISDYSKYVIIGQSRKEQKKVRANNSNLFFASFAASRIAKHGQILLTI